MEQRAGRIIRQGNENPEVTIVRYVTEDTFDAYCYQTIENKQRFISQIMTGKTALRVMEDVDTAALSYAEIKALASGNPEIKEKMDLEITVAKLTALKQTYQREQADLRFQFDRVFPAEIQAAEAQIQAYEADSKTAQAHPKREQFAGMTLLKEQYDTKEAAGKALIEAVKNNDLKTQKVSGWYRGFDFYLNYEAFLNSHQLIFKGEAEYIVELGDDVFGNIRRMDNALSRFPERIEREKARRESLIKQRRDAEEALSKPFEREAELHTKAKRLECLNRKLSSSIDDAVVIEETEQQIERSPPKREAACL